MIIRDAERVMRAGLPRDYSAVAPERCLKISTAILSACCCLSNAIAAI
jgi:hypothetical protein